MGSVSYAPTPPNSLAYSEAPLPVNSKFVDLDDVYGMSPLGVQLATAPTAAAARTILQVGQPSEESLSYSLHVDAFGADPTGASPSDGAVAAAIAELGTRPGVIEFGNGMYRLNSTKTLARSGQYWKAQGIGLTEIDYRGTGPALKCWDALSDPAGDGSPGRGGGLLGGMTINGINNTNNNSIGFQIGDLVNARVEHLRCLGFIRPGGIGFHMMNRFGWTEYGYFEVTSDYNTNCIVIEGHPDHPRPYAGTTSFSYNSFNFGFSAEANQNGVIIRGAVAALGLKWDMKFNCNPGVSNTGVAFKIGTDADVVLPEGASNKSYEYNHIEAEMNFTGETTNPGAVAHKDMMFGPRSSLRGTGALLFNDFSAPFRAGNVLPYEYKVVFAGRVDSPSLGHYARYEIGFVTIGDPGRFGATGNNGRSLQFQENAWGGYPVIQPRVARSEMTWDPVNEENIEDDVSIGIAIRSRLATDETRKSLITIDGVNVVEAISGLGTNCQFDGNAVDGLWVKLATLPPDSETNGSSLQVIGRMGGFEADKIAFWTITLTNRSADFLGNTISALVSVDGKAWNTDPIWENIDLVAFKQPDLSTIFYLKLDGYYVYDLIVKAYQGKVDWDLDTVFEQVWGNDPPVVPTGTEIWKLSEQSQFLKDEPQEIEGVKSFRDDVTFGDGGVFIGGGLPPNALAIHWGATTFGPDQPVYFNNNRLQDVGKPTGYNDAATKGWVEDRYSATTPWGPTADGEPGQIAFDATHIYVCVAANTWRRAALSTWTA